MLCLIEFLDNTYQRKLRILSQGRSEQYEDVIEQYKNMFLAHLNYAKGECKQKKCIYSSACKVMKDGKRPIRRCLPSAFRLYYNHCKSNSIRVFQVG